MAEDFAPPPRRKRAAPKAAGASDTTPLAPASSAHFTETTAMTDTFTSTTGTPGSPDNRTEAKSRFNAAVNEAKAGAAALKAEATDRVDTYREQASRKSQDVLADAKTYAEEARVKGKDLATQGKGKVSEGLTALGNAVADSAHVVDEKLGAKYGDYARSASRSLQDAAVKLDGKTVDDLAEDGRTFVRNSPGAAVGIAAVVGFLLSRLFSGSRR